MFASVMILKISVWTGIHLPQFKVCWQVVVNFLTDCKRREIYSFLRNFQTGKGKLFFEFTPVISVNWHTQIFLSFIHAVKNVLAKFRVISFDLVYLKCMFHFFKWIWINQTQAEHVWFILQYTFRLSSLGHHQVASLYRGNYKMYDMAQLVRCSLLSQKLLVENSTGLHSSVHYDWMMSGENCG